MDDISQGVDAGVDQQPFTQAGSGDSGAGGGGDSGGGGTGNGTTTTIFLYARWPVVLLEYPSGARNTLGCFVGDTPLWIFDIMDDDGGPTGRPVAILPGATLSVTTTRRTQPVNAADSAHVTVVSPSDGRFSYQGQTVDTASAGPINLTVTVVQASGITDTYGPAVINVTSK